MEKHGWQFRNHAQKYERLTILKQFVPIYNLGSDDTHLNFNLGYIDPLDKNNN